MLAGTIDVTLGNTIRVDEGILLKEQMEARGEASVMTIPTKIRYGEVQYRDPQAPAARDVRVRQGMMNALDRQALVDALLRGFTTPADVYLTPNDAAYAASDRVIAKYPFDVNRALALWQNAGWTRGSDGVLRNASGERFDLEVRTTDGAQNVKEGQVLSDFWKQAGINTSLEVVPIAKQNDQEYRAKYPGVSISATSISPDWLAKWQTSEAATEATHWKGGNRGAYSRPELDQMYRQYITTVDPQQRNDRLVQLVKLTSEDVTYLPLYYQVDVHVIRTGLKGLVPRWPGQSGMAFNAYEWSWQ
jgi:peptide/nickel transport system substrate-binding protein